MRHDISQATTLEKYKVYLKLKKKHPYIAKSRLFAICDLDPSREKELNELIHRPDKYADVKKAMRDIYKKRGGKVGRMSMAKDLRKYGYSICEQTARRLMKELGLVYCRHALKL